MDTVVSGILPVGLSRNHNRPAAEYLDLVLSAPGGKVANISKNFCEKVKVLCQVLVNCQMGVSRSSTLALAFLMIKKKK